MIREPFSVGHRSSIIPYSILEYSAHHCWQQLQKIGVSRTYE